MMLYASTVGIGWTEEALLGDFVLDEILVEVDILLDGSLLEARLALDLLGEDNLLEETLLEDDLVADVLLEELLTIGLLLDLIERIDKVIETDVL
jgi:hypothetical protein